jgi:dTDP-4-amino-4,6-dideoxygalactose transaminase
MDVTNEKPPADATRLSPVPFGDLGRVYLRHRAEIDAAVSEVLASGWYILGQAGEAFEREFAAYCGVAHAVGVGNGTDAIELALRAVGVGPGDAVLTSPLSAAFTALAISRIGAEPQFADIDASTCNLDPAAVEAAITPQTRAILPVHLYGQPAEMDAILEIGRRRNIPVIEDAAQAHGARWRGRRVGGLARAAAFSFYPSKNLGAFGDGGCVTTDDPELAERLRMLRNGGQSARYAHDIIGVNSRLDEMQAAILSVRLRHLDADNARRRAIAARYSEALAGQTRVQAPRVAESAEPVFHLYVVQSDDRDSLAAALASQGLGTGVHYPTCIHAQPAYAYLDAPPCPRAERAASRVLSLPIQPELSDAEVDRVVAALRGLS